MRRATTWLCLLIALASPLLSQAKVAYGFGASLAEIGQTALESAQEVADELDDGHEVITLAASAPVGINSPSAFSPTFDALILLTPSSLLPSAFAAVRERHGQWYWPPPTARQRHALLQVFLF